MVLVSVGDKDAADFLFILHHIGKVRDDDVDAQHRFVRERQTAVDDEHIVPTLIDGHVLSDFVKSSQWNDADQRLFSVLFAAPLGAWAGIFRFCCIWCCFLCRLVFCRLCLLLAARIVASAAPCSFFSAGLCFLFPTGRLFDQLDCALNRLAERIDFLVLPWLAVIVSWFAGIRLWTGVFFIHLHFLLVVCGPATQRDLLSLMQPYTSGRSAGCVVWQRLCYLPFCISFPFLLNPARQTTDLCFL